MVYFGRENTVFFNSRRLITMKARIVRWYSRMTSSEEVKGPIGRHQHPEAEHSLPISASYQNLLYGRHIESEFGTDRITILECVCKKRGRCNLLITDQNQACFPKMSTCGFQGESNEQTVRYSGGDLDSPKTELARPPPQEWFRLDIIWKRFSILRTYGRRTAWN